MAWSLLCDRETQQRGQGLCPRFPSSGRPGGQQCHHSGASAQPCCHLPGGEQDVTDSPGCCPMARPPYRDRPRSHPSSSLPPHLSTLFP